MVLAVTAFLYGFSGLGLMGNAVSGKSAAMAGEVREAEETAGDQDKGADINPGEKDLDRLYGELLTGKKKESASKTVMKAAGTSGYFRVVLVNGGTMRAKMIEIGKGSVTITDDRGMVYRMPRSEIFGVEEKDGKYEDGFGK